MKKLKLYLEQIENTVVMRVLEQEGIRTDLSEKVNSASEPQLQNTCIFVRGTLKQSDHKTDCISFKTNNQAEEYLQKVIGWLDEVFSNPVEPKRGDLVEVWDSDIKDISKRIFLAKIDGACFPYITVFKHDEEKFKTGINFDTEIFTNMKPITKQCYNHDTKIYEGVIND